MLNRVSEHVWYMPKDDLTHRPALGYIRSDREAMIVDGGNSPDHIAEFYGNIRSLGLPDPEFATTTHWHWDHVFGLSGTPATTIVFHDTNEKLIDMAHTDWSDASLNARIAAGLELEEHADMIRAEIPMRHSFKVRTADIVFMERMNIRVRDTVCEMYHVGGPHSDDSTAVYIPRDKVVFIGDCCEEDRYGFSGSMNLVKLNAMLKQLKTLDADVYIPSHQEPILKKAFWSKMGRIQKIGEWMDGISEQEEGIGILKKKLGHEPTDEEIVIAMRFISANRFNFI